MKKILLLISLAGFPLISSDTESDNSSYSDSDDSDSDQELSIHINPVSDIYQLALSLEFQDKYKQKLEYILSRYNFLDRFDELDYLFDENGQRILVFTRTRGGLGDVLNATKVAKHLALTSNKKIFLCIETVNLQTGEKTYNTDSYPGITTVTTEKDLMDLVLWDKEKARADHVIITPDVCPASLEWRDKICNYNNADKKRMISLSEYNRQHSWAATGTGFGKSLNRDRNLGILQLSPEEIASISPLKSLTLPFESHEKYYFAYANFLSKLAVLVEFMNGIIKAKDTQKQFNFIFPGVSSIQIDELKNNLAYSKAHYMVYDKNNNLIDQVKTADSPMVKIVTGSFKHEEFLTLLKHAEEPVLTTGDQSFSEALSLRKVTFYEAASWKKNFIQAFIKEMKGTYPNEFVFDEQVVRKKFQDYKKFSNNDKSSALEQKTPQVSPQEGSFCSVCDKKGSLKCSQCKNKFYCSRDCQKKDWPIHKQSCSKK